MDIGEVEKGWREFVDEIGDLTEEELEIAESAFFGALIWYYTRMVSFTRSRDAQRFVKRFAKEMGTEVEERGLPTVH